MTTTRTDATHDRSATLGLVKRATPALLVVASVMLALVVCELALRIGGFRYQTFPTVQFGWPTQTVIAEYFRPDRDLFWVPRNYDAVLSAARASHPAIVFLGDSCTQFGTYPQLVLERLAARRADLATGTAIGVAGWSSEQGRTQLERDVLPLRPRVVTIYFGWNDHWTALGPPDRRARPGAIAFWLSQHLRLAQLAIEVRLATGIMPRADRPNRVSLPRYRENLVTMVHRARDTGIRAVLITAPSHHPPGSEPAVLAERHLRALADLVPLHQAYVQATRDVALAEGAVLCDAAAAFEALEAPLDQYFNADGIHLSELGDQQLATLVADCVLRAAS